MAGVVGYGKHLRPEHCDRPMNRTGAIEVTTRPTPAGPWLTTSRVWSCVVCEARLVEQLVEPPQRRAG